MAREADGDVVREMAAEIRQELKKARGAHRAYVTRTIAIAMERVKNFRTGDKKELLKYKGVLTDKKMVLQKMDEKVLEILSDQSDGDECIKEVEESEAIAMEISEVLLEIEEILDKDTALQHAPVENTSFSGSSSTRKARAKLPKLELQTFDGTPQDWPEFWDAFSSTVDDDEDLPDAVKFQYLKKSLLEPAKSVISGFKMTASNYRAAVELLHQRFAKPTVIKRAHVNEMLKINSVYDERRVDRMRSLHDSVETHFRGLEALHVNEETYASIVVPVLLEKIPQAVRLNIVRASSKDHLEWSVRDFLESLSKEIEVREIQAPIFGTGGTERRGYAPRRMADRLIDGTATALHTWRADSQKQCAFCQENHEEERCSTITNLDTRKSIIRKYVRCFVCIRKGHKAVDCRSKIKCKKCNGKHHTSLCYFSKDSTVSKNPSPLRPSAPPFVGTSTGSTNVASCTNSLGPGSSAALQTALAVVNGNDKVKVRVLFDSGSQKTFVTPTVVERAKLQVVRKENLGIKAFGSETAERKLRDVVELDLRAARGGKRVKVEAYVVEKISEISNCNVEIVKSKYKHLADIEFSDVSDEISLQVDVLVGANFLWEFQGKQTIRGEKNEPVAVETTLGWVLSGPLNGESLLYNLNNVNVTYVEANLESKVEQFWDLDTVGVREDKDIYTEFIDDISYNGKRYSVGLPWKIGHKQLPPNFNASFTRLKSQIRKLKNTPTLLNECNKIIEEQEDLGIIEKVTELEGAEKVYYMPSQVVVREYVSRCEGKSKGLASANVNSNDEETYAQEKLNIVDGQGKTKVLGLVWEEETDNLEIVLDSIGTIRGERDCVTKRSVLSSLAKLFDPLGLVSPVSTIAKSFFQELCVDKIGWDEELPSEKRDKWERWEKDLKQVKSISVPRGIHPYNEKKGKYSLHRVGDTVVVHEDNVKRSLWKLGRIDKFIMGRDGHIRGAKVCVISRNKPDFISRPLQKLYPIEWRQGNTNGDKESVKSSVQESERLKSDKGVEHEIEKGVVKVRRAAAQDSEWRTRLMLDSSESRRGDVLGPKPSLVY